ncbi:UPF0496 protein At1g20180-like isoform X1 [Arachis ipaensis]|uniref:UPF0496 protein At1g20180-like isoform X1 n=1 Tax=Arachis ipaensis TaxID=130454 RepID=UPI0007AF63D8|nr:UPF0496 protein At1g20180-like isoform X1 [Arachis ipaensis]XP_025667741.1 UPF0496 protein At1g20180 isoform X1 [Arachis hypogaea]QHN93226.1 UPF0496 protein [Arachis hypogaea]
MMTPTRRRLLSSLQRAAAGRSPKTQDEDKSYRKPNLNEEYLKAFRTKSYVEICKKFQGQLRKIRSTTGLSSSSSSSSSTSSPLPFFMHLTEYLLEPRQEVIANMVERSEVHHLVLEYFKASLEASQCCDTILQGIHETRIAYAKVTRIIKLSKSVLDGIDEDDQPRKAICGDLASFALQKNPLSIISPTMFREIHDKYMVLLHRLKSKRGKVRRMLTIKRVCKKVGGIAIIASYSALVVALIVFAFHSIVGFVAAPCIIGGSFGLMRKRFNFSRTPSSNDNKRLCEQLDVAARGVYILINDLDTMSRMVNRLHNEVEHRRQVADICLKSGNGKFEILKQVVREFHDYESNFLDQLEELEEHTYLCFLTINRSRKLVMQEIVMEEQEQISVSSHTPLKQESLTSGLALHPLN